MNACDQVELAREYLSEATASLWSDLNLLRRINVAQKTLATRIAQTPGAWLLTSVSVTPSSGIITLPADCSRPVYLETSNGDRINWLSGGVSYRAINRAVGTAYDSGLREVYPLMNTIEVNSSSFSDVCTLWYQKRVPDLHYGYAQTGSGASALVMDTSVTASSNNAGTGRSIQFVNDYYNDVTVEVIDNSSGLVDIRSTISDFVASTHTATIMGTPAATDRYGTVSILPPECHELIVLEAVSLALMKPGAKLDKTVLQYYRAELKDAREEFYGWMESRIAGFSQQAIGEPYL
jgi:hypothetical protein